MTQLHLHSRLSREGNTESREMLKDGCCIKRFEVHHLSPEGQSERQCDLRATEVSREKMFYALRLLTALLIHTLNGSVGHHSSAQLLEKLY